MYQNFQVYAEDKTKGSRNELYFSFCLPSSCSYEDLKSELEKNIRILNNDSDFQLIVDVNQRTCQTTVPIKFTVGDIVFM